MYGLKMPEKVRISMPEELCFVLSGLKKCNLKSKNLKFGRIMFLYQNCSKGDVGSFSVLNPKNNFFDS